MLGPDGHLLDPNFFMPLPDLLPIKPFTQPVNGEVTVPGSKSLTNRALLLAALCDGPVTLTGALFSDDTQIMAEALRQLGFAVEASAARSSIRVVGQGGRIPVHAATIDVGLAGTAARFLTALCAAAPAGIFKIDGVPQMRKRPMRGLIDALRSQGAKIHCPREEGFFPIEVQASGLKGGTVHIDASESSQMLSAILMVAAKAATEVTITLSRPVREPFVAMTAQLMDQFGVTVTYERGSYRVFGGNYHFTVNGGAYAIEPDATTASYFLALPLATQGRVHLAHLHRPSATAAGLQGDLKFVDVLEKAGATVQTRGGGLDSFYAAPQPRRGVSENFNAFSDTFLTLAAISPLLQGTTSITGIAHTRKQETDRVAGMARELKKLGQDVVETQDALTIAPRPLIAGQTIETYGDHRFAMSFAILGCHDLHGDGRPWLTIRDPACCAKTFPAFFEVLESLRQNSLSA